VIFIVRERYLVFTGRPNAGKSSIIRGVIGFHVAISKRPGTTRRISKYPLSGDLVLVDLPGFGRMMGVSKRLEDLKNDEVINFLESFAQNIALAVHVLDISTFSEVTGRLEKKGFISVDVEMVQFLTETSGEFPLVVANKIDKVDKEELEVNLEDFMRQIGKGSPFAVGEHVFPVSAKTGEGLGALKDSIHKRLVAKGYRTPF
jgi:GTP-binding protein EngB required for normal cell division